MTDQLDHLRQALAGRYELEGEIGAGGMAVVYRARDLRHDRLVAIKVLRPDLSASLGSERFLREIKIAAQLQHPHIVQLWDSVAAEGQLAYVMPFVEGETLRARLDREGALPIPETLRILREVADALAAAHARGVVHRDIKPENIMLSGRHALVMDFGVAKAVSEATAPNTKTTAGVALGTPTYMSPEQAVADPQVDHRADLYAFGVIAFEMLAGRPPFDGATAQQVLAAHVTQAPDPVRKYRDTVPAALDSMVSRCLEKRAADRWQTAEELLPILEGMGTPSGGMTPTDTRPVAALPSSRRSRRLPGWVAIAAVVLVAVTAGVAWMIRTDTASATPRVERIAVLPLQNLSGGAVDPFLDQLHDALITELARSNVATITPRSSVLRYRQTDKTIREIGSELRVNAILEATILRVGDKVRVNAQLVDPRNDRHLWSESYEREATDVLALQADLVQAIREGIAAMLRGELAPTVGFAFPPPLPSLAHRAFTLILRAS
jgi:serine/threonine-protein kinase